MSKKDLTMFRHFSFFHVVQMLGLARVRGMSVWLSGRHFWKWKPFDCTSKV